MFGQVVQGRYAAMVREKTMKPPSPDATFSITLALPSLSKASGASEPNSLRASRMMAGSGCSGARTVFSSSQAAWNAASLVSKARFDRPGWFSSAMILSCFSSAYFSSSFAMMTRMISFVPSRIWWTRRSRTIRSSG